MSAEDSELVVRAEAIDCIIDMFSEDHNDVVLRETDAVEKLRKIFVNLKSKVSSF